MPEPTMTTLDIAQENYRAKPTSQRLAIRYRNTALEYWFDDMIGDETLLAILHEIRD